jgi:drug/metabolite transporter (DMT)-like permease
MATQLWAMLLVVIAALIGGFGPIFLKKGSAKFNLNPLKQIKNGNMLLGILFYAVSTIIFIPALKGGELSVLYPIVSLCYVWATLLAVWLLGEKMNRMKWLAIVIIILGVSLVGLGA